MSMSTPATRPPTMPTPASGQRLHSCEFQLGRGAAGVPGPARIVAPPAVAIAARLLGARLDRDNGVAVGHEPRAEPRHEAWMRRIKTAPPASWHRGDCGPRRRVPQVVAVAGDDRPRSGCATRSTLSCARSVLPRLSRYSPAIVAAVQQRHPFVGCRVDHAASSDGRCPGRGWSRVSRRLASRRRSLTR